MSSTFARRSDDRAMNRLVFAGLLALVALNTADVVFTRLVVAHVGVRAESNPLARAILGGYKPEAAKLFVLAALIYFTVTRPKVTVGWLASVYTVVGIYAAATYVNYLVWRQYG